MRVRAMSRATWCGNCRGCRRPIVPGDRIGKIEGGRTKTGKAWKAHQWWCGSCADEVNGQLALSLGILGGGSK